MTRKRFEQLFWNLLISLAVTTSVAVGQDFYPLEARNTWNYRVFYNNYPLPMDSVTTQLSVDADTLMPNGRTYTRLTGPDILGASFVRVDSNYVYYFSPYSGNEVAMYNLRAGVGTVDTIVGWGPLVWSAVASITAQQVLGFQRIVRRYYLDGLVQYEVALADGFGIVDALDKGDGVWPYYASWSIRGCVIRDTLYGTTVDVRYNQELPTTMTLHQNYPNPFNPTTTIEYSLPRAGYATLRIYNVLGEDVATLIDGDHEAGTFSAKWDASHMPSGVYFYHLTAGGYVLTKKMVVMW